jgi:hypothetical protein
MIIKQIKRGLNILLRPEKEFKEINKHSFEKAVADYMKLLVSVGIVAGLLHLLFSIIKAFYLDLFLKIDIDYWRMINYTFSRSISIILFYIFAGTFLVFLISIILIPFFRKIKYVDLLRLLFYSLIPILLFAWLQFNPIPFAIWSIFLFIIGVRSYKSTIIKKDSIKKRN